MKISNNSPELFEGNLGINLIAKNSDTGFIKLDENIAKGASKRQSNHQRKLFKRGQTEMFEFEDQDIRTVSAIILSKDVKGENVLYIEYVQVDLQRSHETQSYRFPFEGWLSSGTVQIV